MTPKPSHDKLEELGISTDDCWLWAGYKDPRGYGYIGGVKKLKEVTGYNQHKYCEYAHRAIYEALVGKIPKGWHIDHLCLVKSCVNPNHLEAVTQGENTRRARGIWNDHCKHGHKFTPENTSTYAYHGSIIRKCKKCHSIANLKRYYKKKLDSQIEELKFMGWELYNDGGVADAEVMDSYIKKRTQELKAEKERL